MYLHIEYTISRIIIDKLRSSTLYVISVVS